MKKIVSIVAALAMATAMFADPEAVSSIAKFDGDASVTWGVDLDSGKTGFKNAVGGGLRLVLMNEGTKATSSDATVWGEIEIKAKGVGFNVDMGNNMKATEPDRTIAPGYDGGMDATMSVEKALLHIGPAWVGIKAGDTQVGDISPVLAVKSSNPWEDNAGYKVAAVGKNATQGITIGFQADGIVKVEADIRSNEGYTDEYATAIQADLLAVPNLTFSVGVAHNLTVGHKNWETGLNDDALFAKAAYELSINDTFYVKPQVGCSLETPEMTFDFDGETYGAKDSKKLVAMGAVLFGWNKNENQGWNGIWGNPKYTANNRSNGASVAIYVVNQSAKEDDVTAVSTNGKLIAGVWDAATLVPNLTFGANFEVENLISDLKVTDKDGELFEEIAKVMEKDRDFVMYKVGVKNYATKTLTAEVKYDIAVGDGKVTPKAGVKVADKFIKEEADKLAEYKFDVKQVSLGVDFTGFVPYTDFSVVYDNADLDTKKGTLDLTCKIHF